MASLWRLPVLFVVENNDYAQSTPVELELAGSIPARGAAFGIEVAELDTTDVVGDPRGCRARGRSDSRDRRAVLPRPPHVPLQPALQGRRQPRPGRDRGAPRARPAGGRRAGGSIRSSARRSRPQVERRLAETVADAEAAPARGARGRMSDRRLERCVQVLNEALHEIFERAGRRLPARGGRARPVRRRVQGDAGPERPLPRPGADDADQRGAACSASPPAWRSAGYRPILEIMFGDFIALGLDQIVNGIAKFREMYDDQVTVPLVVRTPMGGRRGYGPTHSQSLEKLLLGIPNICVVAASECHDLGALLAQAVEDDRPVFFIENKLMYGRPNRRPEDGHVGELAVRETDARYPALSFSGNDFSEAVGDDRHVRRDGAGRARGRDGADPRARDLLRGRRARPQLLPLDLEPVLESVARTRRARHRRGGHARPAASARRSPRGCRSSPGATSASPCGASLRATGSSPPRDRSRTPCCRARATSSRRSSHSKA